MDHEDSKQCFNSLFNQLSKKSMFATLQSDINSLKPVLLHLTGQPNSQNGNTKVKDGVILETILSGAILVNR